MNIPWDEQPTPEHVWIEDFGSELDRDESGWYIRNGQSYIDARGCAWLACFEGDKYKVHRSPEPEFKQGDLVDAIFNRGGMLDLICVEIVAISQNQAWLKGVDISEIVALEHLRKHETERDKFIQISMVATDPAIAKKAAIQLWEAGFRYTGDKE